MELPFPPRIEKHTTDDGISKEISIRLLEGDEVIGTYGGGVSVLDPSRLTPHALHVREDRRGKGYGESIMRSLHDSAETMGVQTIAGSVESEHALRIKAKIFGAEALRFYDMKDSDADRENPDAPDEDTELPITYEQALLSLERAAAFEEDPEKRQRGFYVEADLKTKSE